MALSNKHGDTVPQVNQFNGFQDGCSPPSWIFYKFKLLTAVRAGRPM